MPDTPEGACKKWIDQIQRREHGFLLASGRVAEYGSEGDSARLVDAAGLDAWTHLIRVPSKILESLIGCTSSFFLGKSNCPSVVRVGRRSADGPHIKVHMHKVRSPSREALIYDSGFGLIAAV